MKAITLYEYIKENPGDYDVYDEELDVDPVTVCLDEEDLEHPDDDYTKFIVELLKRTILTDEGGDGCSIVAGWCCLIKRNKELMRNFMMEHWKFTYKDEDRFVEEWIKELRAYVSGYVSEDFYPILLEFAKKLK